LSTQKVRDDYDELATSLCERALVTLTGDIGLWSERIYLVGGLVPRYLVGTLPVGVPPHVGTTDVDLVIGIALADETPETYSTLKANLKKSGFKQQKRSYQWGRHVEGVAVTVEFLCETDTVAGGDIFAPKGEGAGANFNVLNIPGALLVKDDFIEVSVEAERLDKGGLSEVKVRVANVLPFTVLKVLAFQGRHEPKDAYDLVYTLLNHPDGPFGCGQAAAQSRIRDELVVVEAIELLRNRFCDAEQDAPVAYARFLSIGDDENEEARLRQEAVSVVLEFLDGFDS